MTCRGPSCRCNQTPDFGSTTGLTGSGKRTPAFDQPDERAMLRATHRFANAWYWVKKHRGAIGFWLAMLGFLGSVLWLFLRARHAVPVILLGCLLAGCGPKAGGRGPAIDTAPRTDFFMGVFGESEWKKKFDALKIESREDFVKLLGEVNDQQAKNDRLVNQAAIDKANAEAEIERQREEKASALRIAEQEAKVRRMIIMGFVMVSAVLGLAGVALLIMGVLGNKGMIGNGLMLMGIGMGYGTFALVIVPAAAAIAPYAAWAVGLILLLVTFLVGIRIYRSWDDRNGETLLKELMNQRMEASEPNERLRLDGEIAAVQRVYFPDKPLLPAAKVAVPT